MMSALFRSAPPPKNSQKTSRLDSRRLTHQQPTCIKQIILVPSIRCCCLLGFLVNVASSGCLKQHPCSHNGNVKPRVRPPGCRRTWQSQLHHEAGWALRATCIILCFLLFLSLHRAPSEAANGKAGCQVLESRRSHVGLLDSC